MISRIAVTDPRRSEWRSGFRVSAKPPLFLRFAAAVGFFLAVAIMVVRL